MSDLNIFLLLLEGVPFDTHPDNVRDCERTVERLSIIVSAENGKAILRCLHNLTITRLAIVEARNDFVNQDFG
jgi:hypothetical protein